MADEEDKVDDFIRKYFLKGFTQLQRNMLIYSKESRMHFQHYPSEKENQTNWFAQANAVMTLML